MTALCVENLKKEYPSFTLDDISFVVEEGRVSGLVGANGAGKSTTIKSILGLVRATGKVEVFSRPAACAEAKSLIGYAGGGFRFYPQKRLKTLAKAVSRFYPAWSDERFQEFCKRFALDPNKKIAQLSEGMKVKFALALALSHGARLLILDEPTSGLDPFSREEFCDIILSLVREEGISVLFSTHITADLDRIADDVLLLSQGKLLINESLSELTARYMLATFAEPPQEGVVGLKRVKDGFEGLVPKTARIEGARLREPTLDEIIIHIEQERRGNTECVHC